MDPITCKSSKYNKHITELNNFITNKLQITISKQFQPLIDELNNDVNATNELEELNNLIKQTPIYKKITQDYTKKSIYY
jgi:hypothetical protein